MNIGFEIQSHDIKLLVRDVIGDKFQLDRTRNVYLLSYPPRISVYADAPTGHYKRIPDAQGYEIEFTESKYNGSTDFDEVNDAEFIITQRTMMNILSKDILEFILTSVKESLYSVFNLCFSPTNKTLDIKSVKAINRSCKSGRTRKKNITPEFPFQKAFIYSDDEKIYYFIADRYVVEDQMKSAELHIQTTIRVHLKDVIDVILILLKELKEKYLDYVNQNERDYVDMLSRFVVSCNEIFKHFAPRRKHPLVYNMFLLIAYIVHTKNTRKQRPIIIRHTVSKLWQSLSPKDVEILFEFIEYYTFSTHDDSIFRYMSQTTKYENSNVYQNYQIITSFQVSDNYILFEFRYLNFMLAGMAGLHKTTLTYHEIMNITL